MNEKKTLSLSLPTHFHSVWVVGCAITSRRTGRVNFSTVRESMRRERFHAEGVHSFVEKCYNK